MPIKDALKRFFPKKGEPATLSQRFALMALFLSMFSSYPFIEAYFTWQSFLAYPQYYPFDLEVSWCFVVLGVVYIVLAIYFWIKARTIPKGGIFPKFAVLAFICLAFSGGILVIGYIEWFFSKFSWLFWCFILLGAVLIILWVHFWRKARKIPLHAQENQVKQTPTANVGETADAPKGLEN